MEGMPKAHIVDGAAMEKFMGWQKIKLLCKVGWLVKSRSMKSLQVSEQSSQGFGVLVATTA
jgi:hypothetical protein